MNTQMSKKKRRFPRREPPSAETEPRSQRWITWIILSALAAVAGIWVIFVSKPRLEIDHTDPQKIEIGRRVYGEACASCHGRNLEGQPNWRERLPNGRLPAPPHDASGHTWHHTDAALFRMTRNGPAAYPTDYPTDMPAFSGRLTDDEIIAVLAFIKSTWPPDILRSQRQLNSRSSR